MEHTGNKGEWSEVYVLLKLIADGVLKTKAGSAETTYQIIELKRSENDGQKSYELKNDIVSVNVAGGFVRDVVRQDVEHKAAHLLNKIKDLTTKSQMEDSEVSDILSEMECHQLKAKSSDKTDIKIVVHDHYTGLKPELGFSVKSKVGADSTILNPSSATQFTYKLMGDVTPEVLTSVQSMFHTNSKDQKAYEVRDIVEHLYDNGVTLDFINVEHETANANFVKIDSKLPEILAECLLLWFSKSSPSQLPVICDKLNTANPIGFPCGISPDIYHYKLKKFLAEVALGLKPATVWDGQYDATGGFIVVEKNGDITCYHLIQKNILEDYLLDNTYLDTPSSAKFFSYGEVYEEDRVYKIKLTLQIRFKDKLGI